MGTFSLSQYKKIQYLLFGALAFAVLVYLLAVGKTIKLWQENQQLLRENALIQQGPKQIRYFQDKLLSFNSSVGAYLLQKGDNQEKLTQLANAFCQHHHLILREIPVLLLETDQDLELLTTQVVAQGSFTDLLRMVYYFEQEKRVARVTSVQFEKQKDPKTRNTFLSARIVLQNIRIVSK